MYLHKKYFYLYKITNLLNNKIYIGVHSTNNLNDNYMGSGTGITNAINRYGINNFRKEIIEYFDNPEAMFSREKEIVNEDFVKDKTTYNITVGGNIPPKCFGRKMSEFHKQQILNSRLGSSHSEESKKKISQSMMGKNTRPKSEEHKRKISLARLGKKKS